MSKEKTTSKISESAFLKHLKAFEKMTEEQERKIREAFGVEECPGGRARFSDDMWGIVIAHEEE